VGEPGLVPTAPAIANAIYDAIGVRIRDGGRGPDEEREANRLAAVMLIPPDRTRYRRRPASA